MLSLVQKKKYVCIGTAGMQYNVDMILVGYKQIQCSHVILVSVMIKDHMKMVVTTMRYNCLHGIQTLKGL